MSNLRTRLGKFRLDYLSVLYYANAVELKLGMTCIASCHEQGASRRVVEIPYPVSPLMTSITITLGVSGVRCPLQNSSKPTHHENVLGIYVALLGALPNSKDNFVWFVDPFVSGNWLIRWWSLPIMYETLHLAIANHKELLFQRNHLFRGSRWHDCLQLAHEHGGKQSITYHLYIFGAINSNFRGLGPLARPSNRWLRWVTSSRAKVTTHRW